MAASCAVGDVIQSSAAKTVPRNLARGSFLCGPQLAHPSAASFFSACLAIDDSDALDLSYKLLATIDLDLRVRRDGPDLFARNSYRSFKRRLSGAVFEISRLNRVGFDGGLGHDGHPSCPPRHRTISCEPSRSEIAGSFEVL